MLQDLGKLVEKTKNAVKNNFNYEDVGLSEGFKKAFADNIASGGNTIEYLENTAIITTSAGLKIYLPNQWFVLATYPVELIKEIIKYRSYTERIIDCNANAFVGSSGKVLEKKEIYKNLKSTEESDLSEQFKQLTKTFLLEEGQEEGIVEKNCELLYRFVSDDKWWLGGKGIERTNDFYVSPILSVLNLVNASQSYVATITYAYVNDEKLYTELETITNAVTDEEVFNHGLFGIHIKKENDALSEENPHICIGWSGLGDLSNISTREELAALYDAKIEKNNRGKGQDIGQIWRFLYDMKIGDYVIFAEHSVFHIGRVESDYYYDDSNNPKQDSDYTNNRKVVWLRKNLSRSELSSNMHNSLKTAMSIWTLNDYKSAVVDLLRGTYVKDGITEMENEYTELVFNTGFKSKYERNRIVFGAPGTGKSFG